MKEQGIKAIKQEIFNLELALVKEKDPQFAAEQEALLAFYRSKLKAHRKKQVFIGLTLALLAVFALIFSGLGWLYSRDSRDHETGFAQSSKALTSTSSSSTAVLSSSTSPSRPSVLSVPQELLGTWYGREPRIGQALNLELEPSGQFNLAQEGFNGREQSIGWIETLEQVDDATYLINFKSGQIPAGLLALSPDTAGTVYFGLRLAQDQQTLTILRWQSSSSNQVFEPAHFFEETFLDLGRFPLARESLPSSSSAASANVVVDVLEKGILLRPTPGIQVDSSAKIKKGTRGLEVVEILELDGLTWGHLADGRGWIVLEETSWANQLTATLGRDPRNLTTEEVEIWVFAVYRERFDPTIAKSELNMSMTMGTDKLLYILLSGDDIGLGQEYRIDDKGHLQFLSGRDGWITVSNAYPRQ